MGNVHLVVQCRHHAIRIAILAQTYLPVGRAFKLALTRNATKYFTCLLHKNIPADNNKAERALRHLVIKRKLSFGSRTDKGAHTMSVLLSVLYSLQQKNPLNFFREYMAL